MALELRIGSRPSALARAQTELVRVRLAAALPGARLEVVEIRTSGDKMTTASLARVGGKGLFIRELEQALSERKIDLAVHSMKDLPAVLPVGFRIAAVPEREDPRDVLITRDGLELRALPAGTRLGTSSARRRFQALRKNRELEIEPLRGNVDTRLRRVAEGSLDAIIVAMAGLMRLGRSGDVRFCALDESDFLPTGGQAALAIETLADAGLGRSRELASALALIDDPRARYETAAERAYLAAIGASCVTPVGVRASIGTDTMTVRAMLFSGDGAREMHDAVSEPLDPDLAPTAAEDCGARLGEQMLAGGADALVTDG
jgi:hydroxymethylbilane synthase